MIKNNRYKMPETAEEARKMAFIRLDHACALWGGMNYLTMRLKALRDELPGCNKVGKFWFIRPEAMDRFFEGNTAPNRKRH